MEQLATVQAPPARNRLVQVSPTFIARGNPQRYDAPERVPPQAPTQFTSAAIPIPSDASMIVFILTSTVALVMMWSARQLLQPKWEHLAHRFPAQLLHRWSLGLIGLIALYIFFVAPFLILEQFLVAAVAFLVTTAIILISARDVLAWIIEDLREHRATKRPYFQHSAGCVVHAHYGPSDDHSPKQS